LSIITISQRSANANLLSVPRVRTTLASRGFSVAAPALPQSGTHSHLAFATLPLPILSVDFLNLSASSRPLAPPSGSPKCLRLGHWLRLRTLNIHLLTYLLTFLLIYLCSELNNDEQSLKEITSLVNSVSHTISSRLEQLNKAKNYAEKYEEAFAAASAALTAAQKQQTDANSQHQVIHLQHFFLLNYLKSSSV